MVTSCATPPVASPLLCPAIVLLARRPRAPSLHALHWPRVHSPVLRLRGRRVAPLAAAVAALSLSLSLSLSLGGCVVSSDLGGTAFLCSEDPVCPDGTSCVDGRCVAGVPSADAGGDDASSDLLDGGAGAFGFRQQLTIDNAARGELVDFPLLVALDATRIDYGALRPDGADLEFRDAGGALLPHEVERWDPDGRSIVWVRVPLIDARSADGSIWMYYGDPSARVAGDPAAVWSSYEAVYHLEGEEDQLADATARGYDGTSIGAPSEAGLIGLGRRFDGVGQYIDLGTERDFARAAPAITAEAWINPSAVQRGVVFGASVGGAASSRIEVRHELEETVRGGARTQDVGDIQSALTLATVPVDTWSWIAVVCDFGAADVSIYIDGELAGQATALLFDATTPDTPSAQAVIGADEALASDFFAGLIDEVRLAPAAMSADWVSAQNASMRDEMVSYGAPESL